MKTCRLSINIAIKTLLASLLAAFALAAIAAPPRTINYQGILTNSGGTPINSAVSMTFKFYDAASAGNLLHTESQPAVVVTNGNFNVLLGSPTPIPLPFDVPYWLTVTIAGEAEMSPRQPLAGSPYAFRAAALDGAATVAGSQISGTIATATLPAANLTGTIGTAQIANNAVTQAKLSPLTGAAAGKVLGTDGVNLQWQTASVAPTLVFATPSTIYAGRSGTLHLVGESTEFNATTSAGLGPGILINSITALSRSSLRIDYFANSSASAGLRSITATTGAQVLTLTNGLTVIPPVAAVVTVGQLAQGGSALVLARVAAGRSFAPTIAGGALVAGNASFSPSAGISVASNRWLGPDSVELVLEVSPFANVASAASLVVNYSDGSTDTASNFASVGFTPVTTITVGGGPQPSALFVPREARCNERAGQFEVCRHPGTVWPSHAQGAALSRGIGYAHCHRQRHQRLDDGCHQWHLCVFGGGRERRWRGCRLWLCLCARAMTARAGTP
jgi:hypothetical protein